jgi:lipid-A-disaccharide synthase-like uncharacterized protein
MIEIGIAGAILLLAAWLFETYESVKRHKSLIDLKFAMIYITSVILLTIYAYQRNDSVFFYNNLALIALVLFEIFYTVRKTKKR